MNEILDTASDFAFAALERAGGDPQSLPVPLRTLVVIFTAQAIIDNGGFQYLFEQDFPGTPSYSVFSQAYRQIGADAAASLIDQAVSLFPFSEPHLHRDRRCKFVYDTANPAATQIEELGDQLCGNASIWSKLEQYVTLNSAEFA